MAVASRRSAYQEISVADFSAGLNVRDAPTELAPNETPDCLNVTLDSRGGFVKRLGFTFWNNADDSVVAFADQPKFGFSSAQFGVNYWYSQPEATLYKENNGIVTSVLVCTVSPLGEEVDMAEFAGKLYFIHPIDGLFVSHDGNSFRVVEPSSGSVPSGSMLAVWQNKIWVASHASNRLYFCAPGDPTKWDSADAGGFNDIRAGNDFPINALYATSGLDTFAQPVLLVGKRALESSSYQNGDYGQVGSLHRVTDALTGDYVTLDQGIGPASSSSFTSLYGAIYMIAYQGVFQTDGTTALVPVSDKIQPLFDSLVKKASYRWCCAPVIDRVRFSVTSQSSDANDLVLEYQPGFRSWAIRTDAAVCYVARNSTFDQVHGLLGIAPFAGRFQIVLFDNGGADKDADGNSLDIDSRLFSRVFEPVGSYEGRLQHIRVLGRGQFTLEVLRNFQLSGVDKLITIAQDGFTWDTDGWDDPDVGWGSDALEGYGEFWPRQTGRAFQIKMSETSQRSQQREILGQSLETGGWAVFTLRLSLNDFNPST